jgi:hypothetical protein
VAKVRSQGLVAAKEVAPARPKLLRNSLLFIDDRKNYGTKLKKKEYLTAQNATKMGKKRRF